MGLVPILTRWLDIRPGELRPVAISFSGAFLTLSFLILGRSLREALYLTSFDVKTLPYITAGGARLGLPIIGLFSRLVTRHGSRTIFKALLIVLGAGLAILWPFLERFEAAVVLFYLWTALGGMVLASGFWVITSEQFVLRGAKRLFGLIGA